MGLELDPLSLEIITEELLGRKMLHVQTFLNVQGPTEKPDGL